MYVYIHLCVPKYLYPYFYMCNNTCNVKHVYVHVHVFAGVYVFYMHGNIIHMYVSTRV